MKSEYGYREAMEMLMEADDKLRRLEPGTPEHEAQLAECIHLRDRKDEHCPRCGKDQGHPVEMRMSLGFSAGKMCDECWNSSGYRKEGPEGFDPTYAGENYDR